MGTRLTSGDVHIHGKFWRGKRTIRKPTSQEEASRCGSAALVTDRAMEGWYHSSIA